MGVKRWANYPPCKNQEVQKHQLASDSGINSRQLGKLKDLRCGTWNVRSLAMPGKIDIVSEEMERYKLDIITLQETRWPYNGKIYSGSYITYYSGNNDGKYKAGTAITIHKKFENAIIKFDPIDERFCYMRLKGKFNNISVVSIYAPTEDGIEEEKVEFYENLESLMNTLPKYDTKLIMGDANAKIGKEVCWEKTVGKHSLHEITNENGNRLINLATACNLKIVSTFFPRKNIHKITWISPDGNVENQIDHVLIDTRHKNWITNVRSIRGAECGTDHNLVLVKMKQCIKFVKTGKTMVEKK